MKKKQYIILFFTFCFYALTKGQIKQAKLDSVKKYEYEICVFKEAKPGHIIINRQRGIADTTVALVWGQVLERAEPIQFVNVSFTDSQAQIKGAITDANGNYRIHLQKGTYIVKFQYIANNTITIDKLQLGTGQIQEINVDLGKGGGFFTYSISSEKPLTTKEFMKKILFFILILFLFGLSPFGFLNILDTSVSLKYEVGHPRAMSVGDTKALKNIDALEKHYTFRLYLFWIVTVGSPIAALTLLVLNSKRNNNSKMKIICDTNIWYDIASGKASKAGLSKVELYSTYVNLFELAKTQNLVKDWPIVKKAVKALHDNSKGIYEMNPIEFIIKKQFPEYDCQDMTYKQILKGFEELMDRDENVPIEKEVLEKMQNSIDEFALASQKAADSLNAKLPEIREKIKSTIGKKEHRKIISFPLLYEVINVFVGQHTNGAVTLDISSYPWQEVDLFVRTWDNYFKELEVSGNQKFQPNDWQDIFAMVYVTPDYKYTTSEEKWIRLIESDPKTKGYLLKLT